MQSLTDKHVSRPGKSEFPLALLLVASLLVAAPVRAVSLPDTGQTQCDNGSNVLAACNVANSGDAATYRGQDGRFGRDPQAAAGTLTKTGAGTAGFDYTKVANDGTILGAGAAQGTLAGEWGCTRDNVTGLTWELKNTIENHLHDWRATFSWYSTNDATNGNGADTGGPGIGSVAPDVGGDPCHFSVSNPTVACNTQAYVTAVNATSLCGQTNWRLPTQRELLTLVHAGSGTDNPNAGNPSIDSIYFPNTLPSLSGTNDTTIYWSAATYVHPPTSGLILSWAWAVNFADGISNASPKGVDYLVRLVSGAPF